VSTRRERAERRKELKAAEDQGTLEFSFLEKKAAKKRHKGRKKGS